MGLSLPKKLAFALAVDACVIGGAEAGLRLSRFAVAHGSPLEWVGADFGGAFPLERDPELFWRMTPNASMPHMTETFNAHGFRGHDFVDRKPAGVRRVLCLGDSNTFGIGVDATATFASLLEGWLAAAKGARYEVLNLGVPGYSVFQMRRLLERTGLALEPDAIVLYAGAWNDFTPAIGGDDEKLADRSAREQRLDSLRLFQLARSIVAPRAAKDSGGSQRQKYIAEYSAGRKPDGPRVSAESFRRHLEEISSDARRAGALLVLVAPPAPAYTRTRKPDGEDYARVVREVAASRGDRLADARAGLTRPDNRDRTLFFDEIHPSATGHTWIAALVAAELRAGGLPGTEALVPDSLRRPMPIDLYPDLAEGAITPADSERELLPNRATVRVTPPARLRVEGISIPPSSWLELECEFRGAPPGGAVGFEVSAEVDGVVQRLRAHPGIATKNGAYSSGRERIDLGALGGKTVTLLFAVSGVAPKVYWVGPVIRPEEPS
ncbi:MAG TPA: SGNH/GDSL hydrolase family protein [Planctomycetota bacterium]|nr:SGNH/GDSL hydrolase family protein [Planctomycetota bacterium]